LGSEFHNLIVEGKKEFKQVSVLANRIVKRWLCPQVDVARGVKARLKSTRPCNIYKTLLALKNIQVMATVTGQA